jgi:hypothetical protein
MNRSAHNANDSTETLARWRRIGLILVSATLAYNSVEGIPALWAGFQAPWIVVSVNPAGTPLRSSCR